MIIWYVPPAKNDWPGDDHSQFHTAVADSLASVYGLMVDVGSTRDLRHCYDSLLRCKCKRDTLDVWKGTTTMLRRFALKDGSTMDLCKVHRDTMADQVVDDLGKIQGAAWKCAVCTIARRFAGEKKDSDIVHINGYVVVCTPAGATYCTCRAWRYQKIPAEQRTCKHIEEVYGSD